LGLGAVGGVPCSDAALFRTRKSLSCFAHTTKTKSTPNRDLPRGTTAGQLFRRKGVLTIDDTQGAPAAGASPVASPVVSLGASPGEKRYNVNNRLVAGETELEDGDLIILANHVLKI
jgi:hypothetical protein